jgi:hypothetical protein
MFHVNIKTFLKLDQVARIYNGTRVIVSIAKRSDGTQEYRIKLDEFTLKYKKWVKDMKGEYNED